VHEVRAADDGERSDKGLPIEEFDERLALVWAKYHDKARTLALHAAE
jgi:hypothetical protein